MKYRNFLIVCALLFCFVSVFSVIKDEVMADKKAILQDGLIHETAYAYYLSNGELEHIKIYRSATWRSVSIVPITINNQYQLEQARLRFSF